MEPNKRTIGPPEPTIPCLEPSCNHRFYNKNGRSNHIRSWHPHFVTDVQQANALISFKSTPSSRMPSGSLLTYNRSLDSCSQSRGSDHNDHHDNNFNDASDYNSVDSLELPRDDFNDLDIPFDYGEYQHLNDGNQSPSPEPSNAGSYNVHDPASVIPQTCTINKTYHPIINGGSLFTINIPYYHDSPIDLTFRDNL